MCDGEGVTNLLRLLYVLVALPGRLLVRWIDRRKAVNGVPPLGGFLRGCVHGFVWLFALMAFSMATVSPAPVTTPAVQATPRYVPPTVPAGILEPMPTASPTPTSEPEPVYVPIPDDDDDHDWGKPRVCHRKWWC